MICPNLRAFFSASRVAMVFGVISPKINIRRVRIPVAAPAALLPNTSVARTVSMDEADRLTTLLPMSMALSILPWSSAS